MILQITDDFDLQKIAESGQCFRWENTEGNAYRVPHLDMCLYVEALGGGMFRLDCDEKEYQDTWFDYFDLSESYAAIRGRIPKDRDPFLYAAAEREKGIRILRQDPFETLVSFIISQNKNIPAIRKSIALLCQCAGAEREDRRGQIWFSFPGPEQAARLSEAELKACALGYRWEYVQKAARAAADGKIDWNGLKNADPDAAVAALTALKGVGLKVASCAALFGLRRLNAFPRDVWINRVLDQEYPNGYPFLEYAPYNGVYQQYMFAYYRNR